MGRRVVAAGLLGALGSALLALPAAAHDVNGRSVVLIRSLQVVPEGKGWQAALRIVDADSGEPIRSSRVSATFNREGTRNGGVQLTPGTSPGSYAADFAAAPGPLHLALSVQSVPGSAPVLPYEHGWDVDLVAGQATEVVGGSDDGGVAPIVATAAGAVAGLAVLYVLYSARRRRPSVIRG